MKKFIALIVVSWMLVCDGAFSAPRGTRAPVSRPGATATSTQVQSNAGAKSNTSVKNQSANTANNAATNARGARMRSATVSGTTQTGTTVATGAQQPKKINARAAVTQKAVNTGTKIAGATENTLVSEECKTKYYGCMDSFCMMDNANGGRCMCSNRNAELDKVLEEIQKLDEQSYAMATDGVERINMGADADAVEKMVSKITDTDKNKTKNRARSLNLEAWDNAIDESDDDDIFGGANGDDIAKKKGDALQSAVYDLCTKQIPECSANFSMLKLMYAQQIKSDCNAYENSLKQQKNASAKKLQTAQQALREAALEQHQNANKYGLDQCTIRFKQCMQTTAGCGEDFSKCASVVGAENAQVKGTKKKKSSTYSINMGATVINIASSTHDILVAKKVMCESVTKQCVDVKDKVWDSFLRETAPELKSAELIAEDNARQNCIGNISSCFQKACKDNIDPNNPEGSYDMCLSRPETMLNLCKIPLNTCGIDTSSADKAKKSEVWEYVVSRLASMRVDACTKQVKSCLTDENRCGKDYSKCVGLDTDTVINICPSDKLTACNVDANGKKLTQTEVYDNIYNIIEGIMVNIDDSMLTQCRKALQESMIRVCGDAENCENFAVDQDTGSRSFKYQVCAYNDISANGIKWTGKCYDSLDGIPLYELTDPTKSVADAKGWAGKLSGVVYWGDIEYKADENGKYSFTTAEEYINKLIAAGQTVDRDTREDIEQLVFDKEIRSLQNSVERTISAIEADPVVQYCVSGRQVQGLKDKMIGRKVKEDGSSAARFPNLTNDIRERIAVTALKKARENYLAKYDEEIERMMQDQVSAAKKIDAKSAQDNAFLVCQNWATNSALPASKTPKASNAGKWIAVGVIAAVAVVATIFTFGAGGVAGGAAIAVITGSSGVTTITAGTVSAAAAVVAAGAAAGIAAGVDDTKALAGGGSNNQVAGTSSSDQWNYKMTVNTIFTPSTGECTKVTITQNCKKTKKNYCKEWGDTKETSQKVKLM